MATRSQDLEADELALLSEDAQHALRGRLARGTAAVGSVVVFAVWCLELSKGSPDRFELYGFPILAVVLGMLACLRRARLDGWIEGLAMLLGVGFLLERVAFTLGENSTPLLERYVNLYEVMAWFPVVYLFSFALYPKLRASLVSFGLLAASAALVFHSTSDQPERRLDLLEIQIANVACIGFVLLLSALKERYVRTHGVALTLREFAQTDYLTGIANRRHVSAQLEREIEKSRKTGDPLSVVIFDVDRFKRINDTFGHEAGDRVLQRIAGVAQASLREADLLGRWGGEEFLIVLPNVDVELATEVSERIRRVLDAQASIRPAPATASFGVASWQPEDDGESLVRRADAALFEAKSSGRNRVAVSDSS